uniref:hypothetical protein n=1 Tax=Shewanella sp. TaxID=50422 RepID=UPI0040472574
MKYKSSITTTKSLNKELNKAINASKEDIVLYFDFIVNFKKYINDESDLHACAVLYFNNCILSEPTDPNTLHKYHIEITNKHLEQKYNSLDEETQLAITLATGYQHDTPRTVL